MTTGAGNPIGDKLNIMTVGPRGPLLVQDVVFTDEMAHFDRERIPERVVHAKGAGMFYRCIFLPVESGFKKLLSWHISTVGLNDIIICHLINSESSR